MASGDERFRAAATAAGIEVEPVHYPAGTRTAAQAAAAIGCDVAQIVKSLVAVGPEGPVVALTAGDRRLDLDRFAAVLDGPVRLATPEEARASTGFAIGGTPPFGHHEALPTVLDPSLLAHAVVYAAGGTPATCFPIEPGRLRAVTAAEVVDVTTGGAAPG